MSATKPIISMGLMLLLAACAQPVKTHQASVDERQILRRKTVHSPYIAATGTHETRVAYPRHGEYRNYGLVDATLPPIASGPAEPAYAPAEVSPTGSHRTVINQITNEPVHYGQPVP